MIAAIAVRGGSGTTITPPTGWNLIRRIDNGTTISLALYSRVNQSGAATTYTWNFSPSQKASGGIREIADAHPVTPILIENGGVNASSTTHTTVTINNTNASSLLVSSFCTATGTSGTPNTAGGWTEGYDQASGGGQASTRTTSEGQSKTAGSTGNVSNNVVWSGTAAIGASHIMAINPSPYVMSGAIPLSASGNMTANATAVASSPISLIGQASTSASGSSLAGTIPAGVVDGDVLIACMSSFYGGVTLSAPVGWTKFYDNTTSSSTAMFYRVAQSEGATTGNFTGSQSVLGLTILAFRGVHTQHPIQGNVSWVRTPVATATAISPSLDAEVAQTYLIQFVSTSGNRNVTTPASLTVLVNGFTIAGWAGPTHGVLGGPQATAGATGDKSATLSSTAIWIAGLAALTPNTQVIGTIAPSNAVPMSGAENATFSAVRIRTSGPIALTGNSNFSAVPTRQTATTTFVGISERFAEVTNVAGNVYTLTVKLPVPAGRQIMLNTAIRSATAVSISSISGSRGYTWGLLTSTNNSDVYSISWSAVASSGYAVGDTITVTLSATPQNALMGVRYLSNVSSYQGISYGSGASGSTSSLTEVTGSADQTIIPILALGSGTANPTTAGTMQEIGRQQTTTGSNDISLLVGVLQTGAAGSYTHGWDFNTTGLPYAESGINATSLGVGTTKTSGAIALSGTATLTASGTKVASGGGGGFSDITFVGVGATFSYATGTAITPTVPTGIQVGDFLLAAFSFRDEATTMVTVPSGWTLVPGNNPQSASTDSKILSYYKIADGSEGGTQPSFAASASGAGAAIVVAYRGVNTTTPFDLNAVGFASPTSGTVTQVIPAVTTNTDKTMLVVVLGADDEATAADMFTWPVTYTERVDTEGGANVFLGIADRIQTTAGFVAQESITTTTGDFFALHVFGLKPSGTAPAGTTKTSGPVALSGTGNLTASGTTSTSIIRTGGAVALSGVASLSVVGKRYKPATIAISDNFNDNSLGAEWENLSTTFTVTNQNDRLEFAGSAAVVGRALLRTYETQTLTASNAYVEAVQVFSAQSAYRTVFGYGDVRNTTTAFVEIGTDFTSSQRLIFNVRARNGVATVQASATYNSAQHRFWRLREAAGYIYADVSTDSVTWVHPDALDDGNTAWRVQTSTLGGWTIDQDPFYLAAEATSTSGTFPPTAVFDNVNIVRVPEFTNTAKTSGPLNLSGTSNLTTVGRAVRKSSVITLSGAGNMTQTARAIRKSGAVSLTGNSNLTSTARRIARGTAALTASGNLGASARLIHVSGAVALSGSSNLITVAHGTKKSGVVALSGTSTLNASAAQQVVRTSGSIALSGTSNLAAASQAIRRSGAIALSGAGNFTATTHGIKKSGAVALSGIGNATAQARVIHRSGTVALVGNSNLTASSRGIRRSGSIALSGASTMAATSRRIQVRGATLSATGTLGAFAGLSSGAGAIPLSGTSNLTASARRIVRSNAIALSGSGNLTASSRRIKRSLGVALSGTSNLTASSRKIRVNSTPIPLSGSSNLTAVSRAIKRGAASLTGSSILDVVTTSIHRIPPTTLTGTSYMSADGFIAGPVPITPIGGLIRVETDDELFLARSMTADTIFLESRVAGNDDVIAATRTSQLSGISVNRLPSADEIALARTTTADSLAATRTEGSDEILIASRIAGEL